MPAKIATRDKKAATDDFVPFVVIDRQSNRRTYIGPGVDQETAEELAAQLNDAFAAPLAETKLGAYVGAEEE